MKRIPFLIALLLVAGISVVSESALAQNGTPPSYCHPCLFYGGDFDASNPAANVLSNGFEQHGSQSAVYVPFVVPAGQVWVVTGLFSNNMSNNSFLDPPAIKWSISSGLSAGNPGTVIAQGTIHATYTPTGRNWNGLTEYTALGHLTPATAVSLAADVYWMTATPICTDASCGFAGFWMSDVEDVPCPKP
ncbi:MAG: hypothetical protein JWQ87_3832 [Candidatus Sulfotelmatobacter sp.]|nr:hypothetical protein [Candidatus Sulfotelmatobacter sp.]